MKLSVEGKLRLAARTALLAGMTAGAQGVVYAQTGPAAEPSDTPAAEGSTDLGAIEVTGSRLRRVDAETASPVYTIDRATIESRGIATLGELLQEIPSISGAATNPQVNNGGGDGASTVSLRGLGSERTLALLDGRRLGPSFDVNSIPINLIERVEVLKEGASAVYGSDAVGGVVNFITRKDYVGADISYQAGESGRSDGQAQSVEATYGFSNDKGHAIFGLNYNKQNQIGAGNREFSKHALYFYKTYGAITLGSSRTPQGRIYVPSATATQLGLVSSSGAPCGSVTRKDGASGSSASDYRCYTGADAFDYQPYNLVETPQERGSLFADASYNVSDSVEWYTDVFHSQTTSGFVIAPLPVDANNDDIIISADSIYNPFGVDFGGGGSQFLTRTKALGNRFSHVTTVLDQMTTGFKGAIPSTTWTFDAAFTLQHTDQQAKVSGYLVKSALQSAIGPSFIAEDGTPTCGTEDAPIAGCTPVNLFNLSDPANQTALAAITSGYENHFTDTTRIYEVNVNGDLFTWQGGTIKAGIGADYREEFAKTDVDELTEAQAPLFLNCALAQETCSGDSAGNDKVKELYGEIFVPLLQDMPFAKALNVSFGIRYSDYDSFGSTTNSSVKMEYRPFNDLLARASYAEVFRAPTIADRFGAPASTAALFSDPCTHLTNQALAANPNLALACENVTAVDGPITDENPGFVPENSQVSGVLKSNEDLKPETGHVLTYGLVYDPHFIRNLSASVDIWHYKVNQAIASPDVNVIADTCASTGSEEFCSEIHRRDNGQIQYIDLPTTNVGFFETDGVDMGLKYSMPKTRFGSIRASVDSTYTDKFKYSLGEGVPTTNAAGRFDPTFGNYARWRATSSVSWALNSFEFLWSTRFIYGLDITNSEVATVDGNPIHIPSIIYHDFAAAYTYEPTRTKLTLGVQNAFDKQPPLFYQFVLNANTDVNTYDTVGSFFYARLTQSF
ncbi:MAG: TonB-dependent receptor [Hydrocarboniphaga sp.]|uniref:TonB-dependent receptor domain-containing protein n=1 Tax=Hydrocarboniphaga sp. TaxID=2033016 RepID=UPI00263418CB|nr:TonB-dependent receptor [Hydrocarboniphaga sp.]MDB5973191.1 TonB-dependent receptor [Hydrocarboniphaga sp.]